MDLDMLDGVNCHRNDRCCSSHW